MLVGTSGATTANMTLPSGLAIDSTKLPSNTTAAAGRQIGEVVCSLPAQGAHIVTAAGTSTSLVYFSSGDATAQASQLVANATNINVLLSSSTSVSISFSVPISGWGASTQMSDSADTRVVAAIYNLVSGGNTAIGVPVNFDTKIADTHGAVTTGAGVWKFTAPVSGFYQINVTGILASSGSGNLQVYKNGTANIQISNVGTAIYGDGSTVVELKAGEYIDLRPDGNGAFNPAVSATQRNTVSIFRITGPSSISATETIAASYYVSTGASTANTVQYNYDTKLYDTHGAVTTGAGAWKFTAPTAGIYSLSVIGISSSGTGDIVIYKNGSLMSYACGMLTSANNSASIDVKLLAGEYVDFRADATITPLSASGSTYRNMVSIKRVGTI